LVELNQFICDAAKLDLANKVTGLIDSKYALEIFKKNMLESEKVLEKINYFLKSKHIDVSKRLRFLKYGLFYH
jgi:hypothetical protein